MFENFEERDFPDGSGGESLILMIETYFFECNNLIGLLVSGLVDDSISALSDLINALEFVILLVS